MTFSTDTFLLSTDTFITHLWDMGSLCGSINRTISSEPEYYTITPIHGGGVQQIHHDKC